MPERIIKTLEAALQNGANDVVIAEGLAPCIRLGGRIAKMPDAEEIPAGTLDKMLGVLPDAYGVKKVGPYAETMWRVRYSRGAFGKVASFRALLGECPAFDTIGVPDALENCLLLESGLLLFVGPASCGKTTTATSFVSAYCQMATRRVMFLDPVEEYEVPYGDSLVTRATLGDEPEKTVEHAVRSGVDLLWFGDLTKETLLPALLAAESGALVVATLQAGSTAGALSELLVQNETPLARSLVAANLKAVVVEHLLPATDGSVVPAFEVAFNNQNISAQIRSGDFYRIPQYVQAGAAEGMLPLDASLAALVRGNYVAREDAAKVATDPAHI